MIDLLVIGGGAAGFYGAIQTAERNPELQTVILEKTSKVLSKVKISGGGRCNLTHHCFEAKPLATHYPRGEKLLRELFKIYQVKDVVNWFETKGVKLKTEEDGRMFPESDDSQTIIDLFLREAAKHKIEVKKNCAVKKVQKNASHFIVFLEDGAQFKSRTILVAAGGHPNSQAYAWLSDTGHSIVKPIPSLFTFNDSHKEFSELMGIAVPNGLVRIEGTKYLKGGPILVTHWGLSGPAVIKLSAWSAEYLYEKQYIFTALVSWVGDLKEEQARNYFLQYKSNHAKQKIVSNPLYQLPQRLWHKLCQLSDIEDTKLWGDCSLRSINKLVENIIRCRFDIRGKTTFKEEFVTCGGIPLSEIDMTTLESKLLPGLYFAGEILNLDGETGGFNFQAAWTTAYIAAQAISKA